MRTIAIASMIFILAPSISFAAKITWVNDTKRDVNVSGIETPDDACPPSHVIREFKDDFIAEGTSNTRTIQDGVSICWTWHFHTEAETKPDKQCRAVGGDTIHINDVDDTVASCHEKPISPRPKRRSHLRR